MAVRQYVGARYVPKFYQNTQNPQSMDWEGNVPYEALTCVTYNSSTYTSKIPVPAGIGNPASNPTYWALTGSYNAQVEQYRQDVENAVNTINTNLQNTQTKLEGDMTQLKNDVNESVEQAEAKADNTQQNLETEITNRETADNQLSNNIELIAGRYESFKSNKVNAILIGDSYGINYTNAQGEGWTGWMDKVIQADGIDTFHKVDCGGGGFCIAGPNGTFLEALKGIENTITDKGAITHIVVLGGYNDVSKDASDQNLATAMAEFITYARATYPAARPVLGFIAFHWNNSEVQLKCDSMFLKYRHNGSAQGFEFYDPFYFILKSKSYTFISATDANSGFHPNNTGTDEIAIRLIQYIHEGKFTVHNGAVDNGLTCYTENGIYSIYPNETVPAFFSQNVTLPFNTWTNVFNCGENSDLIWGLQTVTPFKFFVFTLNPTTSVPEHYLACRLYGGFLQMNNIASNDPITITTNTVFYIPPFTCDWQSLY